MPRANVVAVVLVGLALGAPRLAQADGRASSVTRLEVESSPEARDCADAEVLRARVAEQLGRDPFSESPPSAAPEKVLRVVFGRTRRGFTGSLAFVGADGERLGGRTFEREGARCAPLVTDVVLSISLLLEELAPRPTSVPPPAPPPPSPEPAPAPPPPARMPAPARERARLDLSVSAGTALGLAPSPAVAGELVAALEVARLRVEGGARAILPASSDRAVAVRAQAVVGRLAPCYGWRVLSACGVLAIGSVSGEATGAGTAASRSEGQLYAGAGAGLVSRAFVLEDVVFLRASAELLFALARAGFDVGPERAWTVPLASASGTLGVGVRLP